MTPAELLSGSPSNLALVRGRVPPAPLRVLLPMRGGPYAELALRLALSRGPAEIVPLHLTRPGDAATDAPFLGLERVLRHLPELHARYATTDDPAATILEQAVGFDLIVMGASAQPESSGTVLGPVAGSPVTFVGDRTNPYYSVATIASSAAIEGYLQMAGGQVVRRKHLSGR